MSICLVAGAGVLPQIIADKATAMGRTLVVLRAGPDPHPVWPDARPFRLETLATTLQTLRQAGCEQICFAGAVRRPKLDISAVDPQTQPLLPRIMAALKGGDDAALTMLLAICDEAGLTPLAPQVIAPDLLPIAGVLAGRLPDHAGADAECAAQAIADLGRADLGQGCVVKKGQIVARETSQGTAWMLEALQPHQQAAGGVLMKAPKPQQDRRIDLPTIGPETIDQAARAGLAGIVVEAGGVLVLDLAETLRRANAAEMFLWVREAQP